MTGSTTGKFGDGGIYQSDGHPHQSHYYDGDPIPANLLHLLRQLTCSATQPPPPSTSLASTILGASNIADPAAAAVNTSAPWNPKQQQQQQTTAALYQEQLQTLLHQAAVVVAANGAAGGGGHGGSMTPLSLLHNLIPSHLQASALAGCSLHGTPGHPSALIRGNHHTSAFPLGPSPLTQPPRWAAVTPATTASDNIIVPAPPPPLPPPPPPPPTITLTVQDCCGGYGPRSAARRRRPPIYNGVNPNYPGLRVLHNAPPMFAVDQFLTPSECHFLMTVAQDSFGPAPVVGKGAGEVSPSRTSSTCYLARQDVPDIMRKVSLLTGQPVRHCELPQVGRYFPSQQYLQHYDAFDLSTDDGRRFAANGGQRTITVLIYLNDVARGGQTYFPALNLSVQPQQGMAVIFFPATIDGLLDQNALHAALPAVDTKYVSQVWIRQSDYAGQPSKRLSHILGAPLPPHELSDPRVPGGARGVAPAVDESSLSSTTPAVAFDGHHHGGGYHHQAQHHGHAFQPRF